MWHVQQIRTKSQSKITDVASHFAESELQSKDDEISMDVWITLLKNERIDICNYTNIFDYGAGK